MRRLFRIIWISSYGMAATHIVHRLFSWISLSTWAQNWMERTRCLIRRQASIVHNIALLWVSAFLACVECTTNRVYEWQSRALSVMPCGVFHSHESAIIILGESEGMYNYASLVLS